MKNYFKILILLAVFEFQNTFAQSVYQHVSNKAIYNFLDEMAELQIIELNSVIKPYTRKFIANKLSEIKNNNESLNTRQQKELAFYLKDFNKEILPDKNFNKRLDLFYYKDSLFTFSVNPIGGIQYWTNENGTAYHRWSGAEAFAYAGNFGFYASLRDNHENPRLNESQYFLNTRQGGNYKYTSDGGGDYSEMRGGITYEWKWGNIGLVKDHFEWGNNHYYPNIFSSKVPSITQLKLNMKPVKWFEFNYTHGWLVSEVIDSSRSLTFTNTYGTNRRDIFFNKYIAANMFSFRPFENLWCSFGNSIVYSADNVQPAYLIPIFFYKSIDHTLNGTDQSGTNVGQNSQMFIDISSRQIKHFHFYSTLFIDELKTSRIFKDDEFNFLSWEGGISISNVIDNVFINFEYTRTSPLTYKHHIPLTTFESNGYNLGHYLQDNSLEYYFSLRYKPIPKFTFKTEYIIAKHGQDHTELGTMPRQSIPFMETEEWSSTSLRTSVRYQIINDGYVFLIYQYSDTRGDVDKYTISLFHGITNTISAGINYGF